jgi:hypothetical protein
MIQRRASMEGFLMRAPQAFLAVAVTIAFSITPRLTKAGPCSNDIAEVERTIQQHGVKALDGLRSASVQLSLQSMPERTGRPDEHLQSQFSATVARAKRLDTRGDRVGCTGALSAARRMYVLVANSEAGG